MFGPLNHSGGHESKRILGQSCSLDCFLQGWAGVKSLLSLSGFTGSIEVKKRFFFQFLIIRFYDVMQNRLINIKIKSSYFVIFTCVIVFLSKIWNLNYNLNRSTFLANLNKKITFSIKWILKVYIVRIPNHRLFCIPWNDFSPKK